MSTCKSCKWWRRGDFGVSEVIGSCDSPKFVVNGRMDGVDFRDGLSVCDMEGLACFETGPDFGCIHHEEKE